MDFLALKPAGAAHPFAQIDIGRQVYTADSSGIFHGVKPNDAQALLNSGACPLPPPKWADPRPVVTIS